MTTRRTLLLTCLHHLVVPKTNVLIVRKTVEDGLWHLREVGSLVHLPEPGIEGELSGAIHQPHDAVESFSDAVLPT